MNDLTISQLQSVLPKIDTPENQQTAAHPSAFGDYMKASLADVNQKIQQADQAVEALASGRNQDIHNTMIAMQKAGISFELVMQIRNKIISAYDEIRRMSI